MRDDTRRTTTMAPMPSMATAGVMATHRLVRADDQLDVVIELVDAEVVGGVEVVPSGPAPAVRVCFGAQHVAERTFSAAEPEVPVVPINHVAAGPSVVVAPFADSFPFTVAGVLEVLAAGGLAGQSRPGTPGVGTTALEIPAGLVLSPSTAARLIAAPAPRSTGATTEIWTATIVPDTPGEALQLAAIQNLLPTDAGLTTRVPDAAARDHIVANSTGIAPLTARRLQLTPAGAFADFRGEWETDLASYAHRIVTGRDVRVEVVTLGYILPFGHRAAIAEIAERTTVDDRDGAPTSVLHVQRFLNIVEPTVTTPRPFARDRGHGLPLVSLTASTSESTPISLRAIDDLDGVVIDGASDLTIHGSGDDLVVEYRCVDRGGNAVSLALPATFVDDAAAHQTGADGAPARLRAVANIDSRLGRREVDLAGQLVAYADPLGGSGPTVSKQSHLFRLAWDGPTDEASDDDMVQTRSPAVFGVLEWAEVVDDVVAAVTGDGGSKIGVSLHPRWLQHGNGPDNFDLAFLRLDDAASSLVGADSVVGGVAQLEVVAEVFNQAAGVGPDLELPDSWDPQQALGAASRIIGNILLENIITTVEDAIPGLDIPGTSLEVGADGTVTTRFTFCPQLHDFEPAGFRTVEGQTRCCVHLTATASVMDEVEAGFETEMRCENFLLEFPPLVPPLVIVDFESIAATVSSDGSTSLVPIIREWDFSGAVSMLVALVDKLGLGSVDLRVLGDVIDMDSSINLPDISLGVAELKNFAINLGLELPLQSGDGRLGIGVGSKSSPLDIDVMMFGATFWLQIDLGFSGGSAPAQTISMGVSVYWEMLDFDIIVVKVAFTLRLSADWKLSGGDVIFSGAVSLEGEVEVLGLISVSASIVCSLTYTSATEQMVLKGTINYCVDSFLGKVTSGSVPIGRTTIELGDGQGPPDAAGVRRLRAATPATGGQSSFADRYTTRAWADYCDAFA